MRKNIFIIIALGIILLIPGCSLTNSKKLISAPKSVGETKPKSSIKNIKIIAQKFIPKGYKLLENSKVINEKSIIEMDIDNDKKNEIIVFFKNDDKFQKGFVVIKYKDNKWSNIYEKIEEANSIYKIDMVNVYNKNEKSLLVGFLISGHAGSKYTVYNFKNNKITELELGLYKKIEILNTPDKDENKGFVYSAWIVEKSNIQTNEIIGFNGGEFYYPEDKYTEYYNKNVIKYYEDMLKESPDNQFVLEKLIQSQIKSGKYDIAIKYVDKALKIKKQSKILPVETYKFNYLKGIALNKLERYSDSEKILNEAENDIVNILSYEMNSLPIQDLYDIKFDLSQVYLELGKSFKEQSKNKEAKQVLNKDFNILKSLEKENYFQYSKIKGIYIKSVEKELKKLN